MRHPAVDASYAKRIKRLYNISASDYEAMLTAQDGVCAICKRVEIYQDALGSRTIRRLNVDHDHKTGRVRALLCSRCNTGLGNFDDDPDLMRSAIAYLAQF